MKKRKITPYPPFLCSLSVKIILFCLLAYPCHGENEFSFRIAPAIEAPLGAKHFSAGFGAAASVDWAFWQFADGFNFGVSVGGGFASLPFATGDPLALMGGKFGPFLRYRPFDRWAFRAAANAGVYSYARGDASEANFMFSGSLGAEFYLSPYFSLFADGEFTYRVFSSRPLNSFGASVGIRLNLSEIMGGRSRVRIERTRQYSVFPVSWAWYEHNPVAAVSVTNEEPNAITDVSLSFFIDSFMSQPWTFAVVPRIAPDESVEVPVTSLFNEAMMNLNETVNANALLRIQYRSLGARKDSSSIIQMPVFRRNMMTWDDNRRAAAFVSPNDFSARAFARYVESAVSSEQLAVSGVPHNVLYAAALFEALRLYGITYIIDPSSSYAAMSEDASALDSLNYPYETLKYRGGDCDDLSILFCSLLEALGVETAFVTVPGHIFIALEVGSDTWQADSNDIIALYDGQGVRKRWLPLEITVPAEGFTRAWRIGARQWRNAINNEQNIEGATLYPIREAWGIYPPVTVPSSGENLQGLPPWDAVIRAVVNEIETMGR